MATAMATGTATATATATAMALATAMAPATAMARAVAMLLLKMDENVNLRLERHFNRAFFLLCTVFLLAQVFFIFFKILGSE